MSIKQSITDDFNICFSSTIKSDLVSKGFSDTEANDIVSSMTSNIDVSTMISSTVDSNVSDVESVSTIVSSQLVKKEENVKNISKQKVINKTHDVQEANTPIKWDEPIMSETKYTSPTDLNKREYTVDEDYPNSYGSIDSVLNWYKVNKITKEVEFVHSSGSSFKIDKEGNSTLHLTGNMKLIIEKDFSIDVIGNVDKIIGGSMYEHVSGDRTENVDGTFLINTVANMIMKAASIMEN